MLLEIEKDAICDIARSPQILCSVVAEPIEMDEQNQDAQAPHEVHNFR